MGSNQNSVAIRVIATTRYLSNTAEMGCLTIKNTDIKVIVYERRQDYILLTVEREGMGTVWSRYDMNYSVTGDLTYLRFLVEVALSRCTETDTVPLV